MLRGRQVADIQYCPPRQQGIGKMKSVKLKNYFSYATLAFGIFALGSTLASNINLSSNTAVEFGQGVAQATSCTGDEKLTVTPFSKYDNSTSFFYLSDISFSNIPANCISNEFIIGVQSANSSVILDGINTIARVLYSGASTTTVYSGQTGTSSFGGEIRSVDESNGYGSFTLHITGDLPLADDVYSISIESKNGLDISSIEAINICVSNLGGEFTATEIINLLGFNSSSELQTAINESQFLFHVAGYDGVPTSGYLTGGGDVSNTQELFCGNSSDNNVHSIDSDSDSNGVFRKDLFLGGAGNDILDMAWNAIFYGGPGDDSITSSSEGGDYYP